MTPEQDARFQLVNIPGQVMQSEVEVGSGDVDVVNQGLGMATSYMRQNGPVRPIQRGYQAPKMTKQQYKEQEMNEAQGLPSNLDEASRVVNLEKTVSNLNTNMAKITSLLERALTPQSVLVQPPTPPVRPVGPPPVPTTMRQLEAETQLPQVSIPSVLATETLTPEVVPPTSPPVSFQPVSQPPASPEMIQEVTNYDPAPQTATLQRPAPVTLGPTGSTGPNPDEDRYELTEESLPGEANEEVAEEPVQAPVDVVEMKRLSRQQMLTDQVTSWLGSKDTHKFWKRFISSACNKNLSYNTWPPEFQGPFDKKFLEMVNDPSFVSVICGRITKMQMGHLVSPHVAGAFVVVTAGFLAFALLEQ